MAVVENFSALPCDRTKCSARIEWLADGSHDVEFWKGGKLIKVRNIAERHVALGHVNAWRNGLRLV